MKSEEMNKKCPECGSTDKSISTVKYPSNKDKLKDAGITETDILVGSIRCSSCGYLFEYCKNGKCLIQVKRIQVG
jgi:Cys-rich peptide (TIGR04165 family)